jgi:hypothetical protein
MSAKHTPGPWNKIGHSIGVDAGEIATVWSEVGNQEHNARLIAAAPDLLYQLINASNRLADMLKGDDGQAWQEAERAIPNIEAAINKALGE